MTTPAPASTEPAPMPHPNDDPDFATARQAKASYASTVDATRAAPPSQMTEIVKAEKISGAYTAYENELRAASERLQARREARHSWLSAQLPIGPGIPDDATPADRTALMGAFRNHYEQAKSMDHAGRAAMLDAADRFGDEPARRAALTAILENGEAKTLERRPDRYATVTAHVAEMIELRSPSSMVRGFEMLAFRMDKKPNEAVQLPHMQQRQAQLDAEAQRQRHRGYF